MMCTIIWWVMLKHLNAIKALDHNIIIHKCLTKLVYTCKIIRKSILHIIDLFVFNKSFFLIIYNNIIYRSYYQVYLENIFCNYMTIFIRQNIQP